MTPIKASACGTDENSVLEMSLTIDLPLPVEIEEFPVRTTVGIPSGVAHGTVVALHDQFSLGAALDTRHTIATHAHGECGQVFTIVQRSGRVPQDPLTVHLTITEAAGPLDKAIGVVTPERAMYLPVTILHTIVYATIRVVEDLGTMSFPIAERDRVDLAVKAVILHRRTVSVAL